MSIPLRNDHHFGSVRSAFTSRMECALHADYAPMNHCRVLLAQGTHPLQIGLKTFHFYKDCRG